MIFLLCVRIGELLFFFKQKTAYEMRISDWSSDVCSSDLDADMLETGLQAAGIRASLDAVLSVAPLQIFKPDRRVYELGRRWADAPAEIGRESWRERVGQYV